MVTEEELLTQLNKSCLPRHVAIIMDGNGRWALARGLKRIFGHQAGMESLREVVKLCVELGIQVLTVYAFSTENWKRSRLEINFLMSLLIKYIYQEIGELCANNVKIKILGNIEKFTPEVQTAINMAIERSQSNNGLNFNIALNYGGRFEIVEATRVIARKVAAGKLDVEKINEALFAGHLYTAGQPDPDLLIRPAGDYRVSNFLLWQIAYTEFWFTEIKWPDFSRIHFLQALIDFQNRERRFGG
ncbi:MAG: isoprenyl transferase [Peptococcaceae bacterium]